MYSVRPNVLLRCLYPSAIWRIPTKEKKIFLTFDDGPIPEVTPWVLSLLKEYKAKATFFCVGANIEKHPEIFRQLISEGHSIGNHTYNHLNGWKTDDKKYLEDINEAANIIDSEFFRPPYGRITKFQLKALQGEKFKLKTIMWDVLSGDFDIKVSPENCYLNVINNAKPGSIIVFHDSIKAFSRLEYALPRVLNFFSEKGFQFKIL